MRSCALVVLLLGFGCSGPPRPPATPAQAEPGDIPPHTQALIEAYRQRSALEAQARSASGQALNHCPGGESELQQRERYLHWIGGCLEEPPLAEHELAAATPDEAAPLVAALDARTDALRSCARLAQVAWWDSEDAVASRLEIDTRGTITNITSLPGQAAREEVACCVRRELRQARLPAPRRALSLVYVANAKPDSMDFKPPQLSKGDVRRTIDSHLVQVRSCYENSMADGSRFEGRVEVQFAIAPDGSTPLARVVRSTMPTPSAGCCIIDVIRSWRFPPNPGVGAVWVTYPFVLELGK
jgi:TonB family protein